MMDQRDKVCSYKNCNFANLLLVFVIGEFYTEMCEDTSNLNHLYTYASTCFPHIGVNLHKHSGTCHLSTHPLVLYRLASVL